MAPRVTCGGLASGFRIQGSGFRVQVTGFRVQVSGCRVGADVGIKEVALGGVDVELGEVVDQLHHPRHHCRLSHLSEEKKNTSSEQIGCENNAARKSCRVVQGQS